MQFLHTARAIFDKACGDGSSWEKYIEWSGLVHLNELVSLDYSLNECLVEPNYKAAEDWDFFPIGQEYDTGCFTSLAYVFKRLKPTERYNLLIVVIEPEQDCGGIVIENYDFVGYDLLGKDFGNSALTNCGGYDETFSASDLNDKGLIGDFEKAYDIKRRLLENNPDEFHADTTVIALWRHKNIGR